jgi:hypothetical protein
MDLFVRPRWYYLVDNPGCMARQDVDGLPVFCELSIDQSFSQHGIRGERVAECPVDEKAAAWAH